MMKYNKSVFNALISEGVPEEWAMLIARRCKPSFHAIWLDAADIVVHGFRWSATPEGYDFWKSFHCGLINEIANQEEVIK